MPSSPPLWTDRPSGEDHDWLTPPPPAPPRPPAPPGEPAQPRRRLVTWRRALATLLLVTALGGAFVLGRDVVGSDSGDAAATAQALPAIKGRPATTRINEIYAKVSAGVVSVQTSTGAGSGGSGTGFVIDPDGTIVTNAHVVDTATRVSVRFDDKGPSVDAEVIGTDPSSDIAVVRVDPKAAKLQPLALADSDDVRVGDTAIAIGYPLGLDRTATAGIVSGLSREIQAPNGFQIDKVIQTDAPINPGNSGGPLIDANGRVIGINSQIATAGSQGNVGIGFAVPSNTVREVVPQLKAGKSIERPYLGVSTSTPLEGSGAVVREVRPGGPAEAAGLQASSTPDGSSGDTILSIDGKRVAGPDDVADAIASKKPGDRVSLRVRRAGGTETTVAVELGRRPDQVSP